VEASPEEKVRVAGLITVVRPYTTKTGKPMGFVTMEDIQGNIELVLFPKTWEKFREGLTVGQIIIVEGKVDQSNPPPKILVDVIKTEIKMTMAADDPYAKQDMTPKPLLPRTEENGPRRADAAPQAKPTVAPVPKNVGHASSVTTPATPQPTKIAEPEAAYDDDGMPPPPDNFPDGWDNEWQPSFDEVAIAAKPEPKFKKNEAVTPPLVTRAVAALGTLDESESAERETLPPPTLYMPLVKENKDKEHPPRQMTVILRSTGDHERDKRRIKTLYGTFTSYNGHDKFSFQIFENGKGHLIDFPNDTTRISPELFERLKKLMGEETWRVEEITFL
jgi:DNA polymerase-3 subunit alpha